MWCDFCSHFYSLLIGKPNKDVSGCPFGGLEIFLALNTIWTVLRVVLGQKKKMIIQKGIAIMLFAPKEKGQGLVEYAIILALVAIVVIAVMRLLGPKIGTTFSSINDSLTIN